jgi:probable phosphoglycerate mutase
MTTFYLIRHAEREGDPERLVGRTEGVRLSARGRRQAAHVAARLAAAPLRHVYASPMERAQETAEPLARGHGLSVEIARGLIEVDFGGWTGKTMTELEQEPGWRQFNAFRSAARAPEGESAAAVQARVVEEIARLRRACPDGAVALVSHGDPIRLALGYFIGAPIDLYSRLEVGLASVSVLTVDDAGATLVRLNETFDDA